ncbi:MAG: hypothetical protein K2Q20_12055, partial [Phycisphaerales bacterium]|nr:hypothetical protein [Phycisphaerales bacterium]
MAVINGELHVLAEQADPLTSLRAPRIVVLRAGVWQQLPWDDAAFGEIVLFTGDGGVPAVVSSRTVSMTVTNRTNEYAVRTFNGTSWTLVASMQRTAPLTGGLRLLDLTIYGGEWYLATTNSANGFLYRSSAGALTQIAQTDTVGCTIVITTCVYTESRSFRALQVGNDGLYVGGRFESVTSSGGTTVPAKNLARFNGTQWEVLSSQPNGPVDGMMLDSTLAVSSQGLVIWGSFSQVGTLSASSIARYRSFTNSWGAFAAGLNGPAKAVVQLSGQSFGTVTYAVVGGFPVGQPGALGISRWTGSAWENYGGADPTVALASPSDFTSAVGFGGLIVGGASLNVNIVPRFGVARWNGTSWTAVAPLQGTNGSSRAIAVHNAHVYVGGDFTSVDSVPAAHVARHNTATGTYEPLGSGINGQVLALTSFGGELIAGGIFSTAGGNPAVNVAAWNGTQWRALGAGLDGAVRAFTVWNGSLVAVGSFDNSGTTGVGSVARWTGSAWVAVDPGFNTTDLYAAATLGTTLYVGGAQGFRRFNGTTFEVPGGAAGTVAGTVYTLFPLLGSLYVGGDFETVGSPAVGYKRIARWSGSAWFAVGPNGTSDFNSGSVRSIFGTADEIYVFGEFNVIAQNASPFATNMARYDGVVWKMLDPQRSDARVLGGTLLGDRVWAVGEFTSIGTSPQVES